MAKQSHVPHFLEIVRSNKACLLRRPRPPVIFFHWARIALFFDFRLYNRNYEGREGGEHMDGKKARPWLRDSEGELTQPWAHILDHGRSGGRLIAAIDRL